MDLTGDPTAATAVLGAPPDHPDARAVWQTAAVELNSYRRRYGITDPRLAYGPPVDDRADPQRAADRARIATRMREYADYLADLPN